ncbi:MAG: stage II sporulation protein D [Bacilli bacterium]
MKQIICVTILLMSIPFFIVFFFFNQSNEIKKIEKKEALIVRVKRVSKEEIEKIEIEHYVVGVLAGEMPITFHIEALKAQAVAARSYVLKRMESNKAEEYDVDDTVNNQVYLDDTYLRERWQSNYETNKKKLQQAVNDTKLQYIAYDGKIADALFFSTSNGFTENSEEIFSFEVPYLRSVESLWDEETSPVFYDTKTYNINNFFTLLGITYSDKLEIEILKKSSTGRILLLKINGIEMEGDAFVDSLGLRSNDFEITKEDNIISIKTNGYGHGVGMSQYGALGMAKEGYTYDEILKHYYNGITIQQYEY